MLEKGYLSLHKGDKSRYLRKIAAMRTKGFFHKLSYCQYPLMGIALFFMFKPYFTDLETIWENYNNALIFMGLSISFSTLQDTTKTQNKFSRKIWENPRKGKVGLVPIGLMALFFIITGLYGIYISASEILEQVSFGMFVLGIGILGMLKAAMEMFENHRLDRKI